MTKKKMGYGMGNKPLARNTRGVSYEQDRGVTPAEKAAAQDAQHRKMFPGKYANGDGTGERTDFD